MSDSHFEPIFESELSRRDLLRNAIAGVLLTMPWIGSAEAAVPPPPKIAFQKNRTGDGIIGPYGEVRVASSNGLVLPAFVQAAGGLAAINLAVRSPFVQVGTDETLITMTSAGVQFGKGAAVKPWTADVVKVLVGTLAKDQKKARGMMLLRSALHTSFPVAVQQFKGNMGPKFGAALANGTAGLGAGAQISCTTTTITETVTRTVREFVDVWKTAEKQYQECYDREVTRSPCKDSGPLAGTCAAGICALKGFVDVVIGVTEVVRTVVEEITRTIVVCVRAAVGTWPNPWDLPGLIGKVTVDQPKRAFTDKDIAAAIDLLSSFTGFFGVYGKCLLKGKWSLIQLTTPLDFGNGNVVLPYGIKVCVSAQCAKDMALSNVGGELLASWGAALAILAALSPEFAAIAASVGISASAVVVAAAAAVPEIVVACAALILAAILAALVYGTLVAAQLEYHRIATDHFNDNVVCIEHPTFAIALIELWTQGMVPARAIPPIVTG